MIRWPLLFVLIYVALALGVDTLAVQGVVWPFDWGIFRWRLTDVYQWVQPAASALGLPEALYAWLQWRLPQKFDVYSFFFWLALPFLLCVRGLDWGAFGWARFKRADWIVLALLAAVGAAAMFLIPYVPELRRTYPNLSHLEHGVKLDYFRGQLIWILSWLPGWEFLHRYFLLRALAARWPRFGWLLVPLAEGLYHLQKPLLEAGGMVLLSLVLTRWALARNNVLLPFLAHFIIEIEVVLFMLLA